MAFISDTEALRTYDLERDLQLSSGGGGSDGSCDFYFHRIGDKEGERLGGFTAYLETRQPTEKEKIAQPGVKGVATWHITGSRRWKIGGGGLPIKGFSLEESKAIIREAMLSYRYVCGNPVDTGRLYFVKFDF